MSQVFGEVEMSFAWRQGKTGIEALSGWDTNESGREREKIKFSCGVCWLSEEIVSVCLFNICKSG